MRPDPDETGYINQPFTTTGWLGWANESGLAHRTSRYQLYGPGGRWQEPRGDYIEDHLNAAGEGTDVLLVCRPRRSMGQEEWEDLQTEIENLLDEYIRLGS